MCQGNVQDISPWLRNPADAHIDFRNLVPGGIVHNTGLGQVKDSLKGTHGIGRVGTINTIGGDSWNRRVVLGDTVYLLLDLHHLITGGSYIQVIAGP